MKDRFIPIWAIIVVLIYFLLFYGVVTSHAAGGWRYTGPVIQGFDSNGDPLSAGYLYSYTCGTTTNKATYPTKADAEAGTNANANPIDLNSRGEASVFAVGCTKFVLKATLGGTVIWTDDNSYGMDDLSTDTTFLVEHESTGAHYINSAYNYPVAAASDHGVTGSSNTIKYYGDTIGATDLGTIYLAHDSGSTNTDYIFLTSYTGTSNITVELEPGARISPASGVTVYAKIKAGDHQIKTGDGVLIPLNDTIQSSWWGDTGDNSTDDYGALNEAFTALAQTAGQKLVIGPGFHLMSSGVTWQGEHTQVDCQGTLHYNSASAGTAVTIGNDSSGTRGLRGNIRVGDATGTDWTTAKIGVKAINLQESTLHIDVGEDGGFQTGLKVMGDNSTGNSYNKYFLGVMWNNKIGVHTFAQNSGWANENTFYGGRFSCSTAQSGSALISGGYHIKNEHGNNNTYFRPSFEQQYYEYYMYSNDDYTSLIFPRLESGVNGPTYNVFADTGAAGFSFLASYFDSTQLTLNPSNGYVNLSTNGWHMAWDRSRMRLPKGSQWSSGTGAAPTTGTYRKGDIHHQYDANFGDSMLQYCTSNGSFSSATDSTGDTDGSTAVITGMTDTSDFYVGEYVSASTGFPTVSNGNYMRIIAKTSTTITLDTSSDSAKSNITVATVDPVFVKVLQVQAEHTLQTITFASGVTPNMAEGNIVQVSPTGNLMVDNPTNLSAGQRLYLYLICDGSNRDITFGSYFKATPFTLTANKRKLIEFLAVTSSTLVQINTGIEND